MAQAKKIIKEFDLDEISGVDMPAQPTAKYSIMKRDNSISKALDFASELGKIKLDSLLWPLSDAFNRVVQGIVTYKDFTDSDKAIKIKEAADIFGDTLAQELSNSKNPISAPVVESGLITLTEEENKDMSDELKKSLEDAKAELEKAKTELVKAEQFGDLTDLEKEELKEMSEEDKAKFLASTKEERELSKSADETLEVAGHTISKRAVGVETFDVLKSQQAVIKAQNDAVIKAKEEAKTAELLKRASDEFGALPGTDLEIAEVLKAVEGLSEGVQKSLQNIMRAGTKTVEAATITKGVSTGGDNKKATEQLDSLSKAYAKDNKVTYAQAYSNVIQSRPELYVDSLNEL